MLAFLANLDPAVPQVRSKVPRVGTGVWHHPECTHMHTMRRALALARASARVGAPTFARVNLRVGVFASAPTASSATASAICTHPTYALTPHPLTSPERYSTTPLQRSSSGL